MEGNNLMKKIIFIVALVFALILLVVAYIISWPKDAPVDILEAHEDVYEQYQPHEYETDNQIGEELYESNESVISSEAPDMYEPYLPHDPMHDGDTSNPWHPIHFTDIRPAQPLDENTPHGYIAVGHIQYMSEHFYRRFPFSYQEKYAATWIVEELLAMGYTWDNIYVQEFGWAETIDFLRSDRNLDTLATFGVIYDNYYYLRYTYQSQNVVLTVPGQSDQVIVIGAHYDTVLYPGASDNASGTALLLENAQRMLHMDNYYTLVYIFFGAEEAGLLGAYYYVASLTDEDLEKIVFMANADVLFEGPYFIFAAGHQNDNGSEVVNQNMITRQWDDIAYQLSHTHGITLISNPSSVFLGSDHLPFLEASVTVMVMFGAAYNTAGLRYFRVLHSHRDCFDYITERWPYKIEDAMRTFSIFLEEVLLASYG